MVGVTTVGILWGEGLAQWGSWCGGVKFGGWCRVGMRVGWEGGISGEWCQLQRQQGKPTS